MELNICHLYPDLLNTYGDCGNLLLIENRAKECGISVNRIALSVGEAFTPGAYDLVFLGGGQDFEQTIVAEDLLKTKRDALAAYVENGGAMLAICGGFQLMGEYYAAPNGERLEGLGILPIYTEGGKKRLIGNIVLQNGSETYVGFENHSGRTYIGSLPPLGRVVYGFGNNGEDKTEGCVYNNVICTYLHGPLLSKNPELTDLLLQSALQQKAPDFVLPPRQDTLEYKAKEAMLKKLELAISN